MSSSLLLDVVDGSKRFGGLQALESVGLQVPNMMQSLV